MFALDHVKVIAAKQPDWKTQESFASVLRTTSPARALFTATHTGMTVEEFEQSVKDSIETAKHPATMQPVTETRTDVQREFA